VWCCGQGRELCGQLPLPVEAQSLDELVLILRASAQLRFDPSVNGYHLYGTDIVQTARAAGHSALIVSLPVVHNSARLWHLDRSFWAAYSRLRRKWWSALPLRTPCTQITKGRLCEVKQRLCHLRDMLRGRPKYRTNLTHGRDVAVLAGYEAGSPSPTNQVHIAPGNDG
jgi:hypothetical protein